MTADSLSVGPIGGASASERIAPVREIRPSTERSTEQAHLVNNSNEMKKLMLRGERITVGEEQVIRAIERANKAIQGATTAFEFSIHEKTKQIMVKVLDKDTGEVIREIPPEKTLDMVAHMWKIAGILIDERR